MIRHAKATVAVSALLLTLLLVPTAIADAPPVVSVEPATPSYTSAQLKGEVNPNGGPSTTFWQLQYASGSDGPWELAGSGEFAGTEAEATTPLPVTANATGLNPNTTYFFRLLAINEDGANQAIRVGPSFTTLEVNPASVAIDPIVTFTATSAHFSGEVNPNAPKEEAETSDAEKEAFLTAYHFQCTPACPGLQGELAADNTSHEVEADAAGLKPGTEYSVSLIAKNAGPEASAGPEVFTTPALAPIISSFSVSDVDSDTAILHAQLNPAGATTAYRFEYVELAEFEANGFTNAAKAPEPDGSLSAGNTNVPLEETITGLDPATDYRFRVVATNALDTTESAPKGFKTFATAAPVTLGKFPGQGFLPDNRAWELVSPTDKEGGEVIGNTTASRAAADGDAFQYASLQAFADAIGTGITTEYIAERSADPDPGDNGWSTHAITPKQESGTVNGGATGLAPYYLGNFSADLSRGVFQAISPIGPTPNVEESINFYLRDDLRNAGAGNYQLLSACPACSKPLPETAGLLVASAPKYAGASADFGHVVFQSPFNLSADAPPQSFFCELLGFGCEQRLYEWDHGTLRHVGFLPDGTGAVRAGAGSGATAPGPESQLAIVLHPISSDGSRIAFTVRSDPADHPGDLYSRVNGRTTIPLDASERAVPASPASSRYWDASADHSRVFFTSGESLTEDAPLGQNKLYMWKQADHNETQQVTVDASGGSFVLSFNGAATSAVGTGDLIGPASGSGDLSEGSETVSNLNTSSGAFAVGQVVEGPGIPAGTTINEVNPGSLTLSNTASETASAVAITGLVSTKVSNVGAASGAFSIGQPISGAGIAPNTTVTDVLGSGVIELSAPPTATGTGVALSAGTQLAFNASPAQVAAALEQLAAVKAGNVSVSGGPGSAGGATPYLITFQGDFAGANVAELSADGSGLTGGAGASVSTTQPVENLTYLNLDGEPADVSNGVEGVIGASDDGRYLYFVTTGQLVPGKPLLGADRGIYLWHEGTISYIGESSNSGADGGEWYTGGLAVLTLNQTHITPDGRHLFLRVKSGVGLLSAHGGSDYDHGPFGQFYVYSAEGDELECASCNPSGAPATAQAEGRGVFGSGALVPTTYQNASRFLSDDGRYAFFSTAEALVPADINKRIDAYRYDTSTGKASLLSSGQSPTDSFFLDASANGKDAFFITQEQLSGWDVDAAYDLYDARVEGGFPEPSPPPPSCQGDACQPPPIQLNDATPSSSSFQGAGDQQGRKGGKARRCPQGQRRVKARGGKSRCVRRQGKENRKRATSNDRRAGR